MMFPFEVAPCDECFAPVCRRHLLPHQKAAFKIFERELKRWKKLLKMDPLWEIYVLILPEEQMGDAAAAADIGESEYYKANILVRQTALDVGEEDRFAEMRRIACHEMLHVSTADYQRAALTAAANARGRQEISYRYEQMIVRMTAVLTAMDDELRKGARRKRNESEGGSGD